MSEHARRACRPYRNAGEVAGGPLRAGERIDPRAP